MKRRSEYPIVLKCCGLFAMCKTEDGDRALVDTLLDVVAANIDLLEIARPELRLGKIDFVITGGENSDALAVQDAGKMAVFIDIGLLRLFWERAATAVHIPSVFADYLPFDGDEPVDWFSADIDVVPPLALWKIPDDRKDYCIEIFQHMLEYLVLHELAHHMRGHLDLIDGHQNFAALGEVTIRNLGWHQDAEGAFQIQDLELDADAHALDLSVTALKAKFPDGSFEWDIDTVSETLFLLMFSQILVAQLFDDKSTGSQSRPTNEHPAPIFRSINYTNLARHTFHGLTGGELSSYQNIHDAAWTEAGHVAKFLGFPYGRWHGDKVRTLATKQYLEIERRYFKVTELVDRHIDGNASS